MASHARSVDTTPSHRSRHPVALGLWLGATGCSSPAGAPVDTVREPVVYGADDRREAFEYGERDWRRSVAQSSLVAIGHRIDVETASGAPRIAAANARERFGLCEGERFAEQPAFAFCTGVAVERDLVLTAGHCLAIGAPEEIAVLSGYYFAAPGNLAELDASRIHAIAEIAHYDADSDYALLRLDGAARLTPVPILHDLSGATFRIVGVNHGMGLPAKVDDGGRAYALDQTTLLTSLDAFGGASGGPVFTESGALVGILVSGGPDYVLGDGGCMRAHVVSDSQDAASELVLRVPPLGGESAGSSRASSRPPEHAGCSVRRDGGPRSIELTLAALLAILRLARRERETSERGSSGTCSGTTSIPAPAARES
jgi:hypothetical protein